jgi:4-hydroxy-4-methyl-2-oxoglutarate aldolase
MNFKSECEMFDYLEQNCYAAVFSDVLDELGYRFQVISPTSNIRPLKDEYVAAGRAATMLNADDDRMDEPYDLAIKCMGNLKQDSIILTTANTHLDMGIMGELSATALRARGCRGAIVNGYTRDVRKLKEMNFPTFAWGSSAIDTTGRARVVDYNIPITVGGVKIFPEDLIFCDLDGIVVIPKKVEDEVISKTLLLIKTESMVREELAQGIEISEVWEKYHIL